ncbi:MAG: dephospho-CoA kinase [Anaerolineae bacterium]|nr:dephospho-CoA kinase [Anaerolineae bacterium]
MGHWANKYVIGLTGNIAMGKSAVRKLLEHLGAYTIDADGLAHQTMVPGAPAYLPVVETFGRWILDREGKIDRSKLGAVVFSHPEALARLEAITHPLVSQGIDTLISRAKQPIVVIEAIKLLESKLASQVDAIWVVDCKPELQLQRLIEKRGMSEQEARKRIEGQNPQREKLARANVVITNNGTPQELWTQVEAEWNKLLNALKMSRRDDAQAVRIATAPSATPITEPTAPPQHSTAEPAKSRPEPLPSQRPSTLPPTAPYQAAAPSPAAVPSIAVDIRRGMPKNAERIAQVMNRLLGKNLTRMDIMTAFGEKSYMLAEINGQIMGVIGFQVENLVTRVDEFLLVPEAPLEPVARALIQAVENASKELQSEVGFVYLPINAPMPIIQIFIKNGYKRVDLDAIEVPPWREAAQESQPPNTQIFVKKLRPDRVLKPL